MKHEPGATEKMLTGCSATVPNPNLVEFSEEVIRQIMGDALGLAERIDVQCEVLTAQLKLRKRMFQNSHFRRVPHWVQVKREVEAVREIQNPFGS